MSINEDIWEELFNAKEKLSSDHVKAFLSETGNYFSLAEKSVVQRVHGWLNSKLILNWAKCGPRGREGN